MAEKKDKDPRGNAVVKSERAVNSILSGLERLGRKGRGLTDKQKIAAMKAVDDAVTFTKSVLAGKAAAKSGFQLGAE